MIFAMTGSLVLPLKALLMNACSVAATFGLLVLIFQDHVLGLQHLVAFDGPRALEASTSIVVLAATFGLATDYTILLLSRIKEQHDTGAPTPHAIATGMQRSGWVITNAAILLAAALLTLASSRVYLAKELTVGIAIGVAIDATLVRALLVPSLMRLLGELNWWAPAGLRRLLQAAAARKG
jgi:RND superfamily putative drug exporter